MEHLLTSAGYAALALLAFVEACCIPIPSEVTFGFAGVLASQGRLNFVVVILIGSLAELCGSLLAYAIGRVGGRPLVDRLGRYVLLTKSDLDRAERFFDGKGEWAVLVGRALPVVRAFVSIVAGIAEMAPLRFALFSFAGTAIYTTVLTAIGYGVGSTWTRVARAFSVAGYVIAALVVVAVAAVVVHRLRVLRHEREAVAEAEGVAGR